MNQTHAPLSSPSDHGIVASKTPILEWTAAIHPVHERSQRWYLVGSVAVLGTAVYGILTGAWTTALVSLLVGGLYFLLRKEPPTLKHIALLNAGYTLDGRLTFWGDCKNFWLVHTHGYTELHIRKLKGPAPETIIQTGAIDPTLIRTTLSQFIKMKEDHKEQFVDTLIRFCKL